jgi:hypothetical protein
MAEATGHNAYFGLSACHAALLTNEETFEYGNVIDIGELGGIIEIALDAQTSNDPSYATDRVWIDSESDNGFEGTMRIANVWGHPDLRKFFAAACGYEFAADGTLLGTANGKRVPFALMSQSSGNLEDKRICYLKVQAGKPGKNQQTKEDGSTLQADEFPITARAVKLPSGWTGAFYENIPADGKPYNEFFDAVRTDLEPAAAQQGGAGEGNGEGNGEG